MYTSKRVLIITILFILLFTSYSFADTDLQDIDDKIEKQNEYLYEEIMKNQSNDTNILEKILEDSDRRNREQPTEINLSSISSSLQRASIVLAVKARKFIVPVTVLIVLFNIFMLSATGAKNLANRKKYIYGTIFFYIFFLIVLNFPLYLLWRSSIGAEDLVNYDAFYKFVEGVSIYLRDNSFVFFTIIFAFGVVNLISSETNLPKKLASEFMIKMAFILFAAFNIIPFILKLAI